MGLTYNRFHVTAVCSPTRAAMLTGRNHHRVGFGSIAEYPGPFPGYTAARPRSCTALPRILQENGYVTGGFGKWHLTPDNVQGAAGPFDHWPQSWGFDHWWGFLSGAAGQYDPIITQDNSVLGVPPGKDGQPYYSPDDLTDKAVEWLHSVRAQDATKPWFMYYSTGCSHAPHHVPKDWADRYKGRFDEGWDVYRQRTFVRQKQLGIVPPDTELTDRPDLFPAWDSLSDTQKQLYARQMEVFAGYSENADWNVGRLLDAIETMGDLENTLVVYVWGDNGASMEGTITGSFNETTFLNGVVLDADQQLVLIDDYGGIDALGGEHTAPHFAASWAHANNTPFQWGKQMASHLGGARDAAAASAPSSPTASTWPPRSWRRSACRSRSGWMGSSRSRWMAPASSTRSMMPLRPSATRSSTSRCSAAAPSTRTAGGPAPASTRPHGISHRKHFGASPPGSTTRNVMTCGSCITSPTISARPATSSLTIPTSWQS
jgi:arylsulfatase